MCITKGYEIIRFKSAEEKLAWLASRLFNNMGRNIVYCFSNIETEQIHTFFQMIGIKSAILKDGRTGRTSKSEQMKTAELKQSFLRGQINVLITVFSHSVDVSELQGRIDEVFFYQKPVFYTNIKVAHSDCFGDLMGKCTILLSPEKIAMDHHFWQKSENVETVSLITEFFENGANELSEKEIQCYINKSSGEIRYSLIFLEKTGVLRRAGTKYFYQGKVPAEAEKELYCGEKSLKEQYYKMIRFCNEVGVRDCRKDEVFYGFLKKAEQFFCDHTYKIAPKKVWPTGFQVNERNKIDNPYEEGIAIAENIHYGCGVIIDRDLSCGNITRELLDIVVEKLAGYVQQNHIKWISYVDEPEARDGMKAFAEKLGEHLKLFVTNTISVADVDKVYKNPVQECYGIAQSYQLDIQKCYQGNVLLLKKTAGSGYGLAYCSTLLQNAGCGRVFPCTLLLEEERYSTFPVPKGKYDDLINVVQRRQIESFVHFTKIENLENIIKYGLLPVRTLNEQGISYINSDRIRLDGHKDAVSISVSFPNNYMFFNKRNIDRDQNWIVMELRPEVVLNNKCLFCKTNAANKNVLFEQEYKMSALGSAEAFEDMFAENRQQNRKYRNLPPYYPTDVQAEILSFDRIPSDAIKKIYFDDKAAFEKYGGIVSAAGIEISMEDKYFKNREDFGGQRIYGEQTSLS